MILLMFLLITKHFFADFILQSPWMVFNKGNWKSLAGYAHASVHGLGTFFALILYSMLQHNVGLIAFGIVAWEMIVHYTIDFVKVHWGKSEGYTPSDKAFWNLLGFDQYLHYLTYIVICLAVQ